MIALSLVILASAAGIFLSGFWLGRKRQRPSVTAEPIPATRAVLHAAKRRGRGGYRAVVIPGWLLVKLLEESQQRDATAEILMRDVCQVLSSLELRQEGWKEMQP